MAHSAHKMPYVAKQEGRVKTVDNESRHGVAGCSFTEIMETVTGHFAQESIRRIGKTVDQAEQRERYAGENSRNDAHPEHGQGSHGRQDAAARIEFVNAGHGMKFDQGKSAADQN